MKADVEARLAALSRKIEDAEAAVARDGAVDLGRLDGEISRLCADLRALPVDEGQALLPAVESLLAGFDRLEAAMAQRFETLKTELQAHGRRTRAARAYGQQAARGRQED